jgi:hypothetical protein
MTKQISSGTPHSGVPRHRRFGMLSGMLGVGAVAAAMLCQAAPALATPTVPCPTAPKTWPSSPRVMVHLSELTASGADFGSELMMLAQVGDSVNALNTIGASSAQVSGIDDTLDPFRWGASYDDAVPTIHVGWTTAAQIAADANNGGRGGAALTSPKIYLDANCTPTMSIEFQDLNNMAWAFNSPFALAGEGASYYDAGPTAPLVAGDTPIGANGGTWFRPSFLHELLHAFGMQHTATHFATMNHRGSGGFPWANRADDNAMMPLPYDVGVLRSTYPGSGTRWDLAPLNNWYVFTPGAGGSVGDAADQVKLCTPSLGSAFSADKTTDGPCGEGGPKSGSTEVGQGDVLRTRFSLANYSTGSMKTTSALWLSTDDTWDASDIPVPGSKSVTVKANASAFVPAKWTLPALTPGTTYHAIIRVASEHVNADGSIDPASMRTDWNPLRGTVCGKPCS